MRIGVPKEIKNNELRVALTPAGVTDLVKHGHEVFVEAGAGVGSDFADELYAAQGAKMLSTAAEVWENADMIIKVKEPLEEEYKFFREDSNPLYLLAPCCRRKTYTTPHAIKRLSLLPMKP